MSRFFLVAILAAAILIAGPRAGASIPGYACYRTVEETESAMYDLEAAHPALVTLIDIGDSWEKSEAGGAPGYDI